MFSNIYHRLGVLCSTRPWEVIVATISLTVSLAFVDNSAAPPLSIEPPYHCNGQSCQEYKMIDAILMTAIRCVAVLYSYYQFCNLHKIGSKYILGMAGLFTGFSILVFSSSVINYLKGDVSDLKDALFFFLLLIDLSKATLLAQFALSGSNQAEVELNIAKGMELVGPSVTLDTIVETLVISIGTLSGIRRLEVLCYFACMSVIVNYILFMTFFPACLSLILELTSTSHKDEKNAEVSKNKWKAYFLKEQGQKSNPVVQRVKIIMSLGLLIVHIHSRWVIKGVDEEGVMPLVRNEHIVPMNGTDNKALQGYLLRLFTLSADHVVILILLIALTVIFTLFEDKKELIQEKMNGIQNYNDDTDMQMKILTTENQKKVNSYENEIAALKCNDDHIQFTIGEDSDDDCKKDIPTRPLNECIDIYSHEGLADNLNDEEILNLVSEGNIQAYYLEKVFKSPERGVKLRRKVVGKTGGFLHAFYNVPYKNYPYEKVLGACCENVVGFVPIPLGIAGPLLLDGRQIYIPMATTEGCLVASTNRGCRALMHGGVTSRVVSDGMTRGPVVRFISIVEASEAMKWIQDEENFLKLKEKFDSTSRFARLLRLQVRIASRMLYIRFVATTGDAMGMNMVSKGTEEALKFMQSEFPYMEILSLSGNICSDKKPAAVNWVEGRGKSVVCEAIIPSDVVKRILKTNVKSIIDVNNNKNLIGSAIAGSIGGFNAHAANTVTAIYIATGQDPAQNVGSSNCITLMETWGENEEDLYVSCTMPSIEIGTIGGGTQLPTQAACLEMLGVKGAHEEIPGENAKTLARIICGAVLAGELSLIAALTAGHLVKSHLRHNRSSVKINC